MDVATAKITYDRTPVADFYFPNESIPSPFLFPPLARQPIVAPAQSPLPIPELSLLTYNICGDERLLPARPESTERNSKGWYDSFLHFARDVGAFCNVVKVTSDARFHAIGRKLKSLDASVVGIQEGWSRDTEATILSSEYPFHVAADHKHGLVGRSGLVTLSKYEITKSEFYDFKSSCGLERVVRKGALYTEIHLGAGFHIHVVNVHLAASPEGSQKLFINNADAERTRTLQIKELDTWLQDRILPHRPNAPVIFLGDFNTATTREEDLLRRLGKDLYCMSNQISLGDASGRDHCTFDVEENPYARGKLDEAFLRLDRVLAKNISAFGEIDLRSEKLFNKGNEIFSDHFGLMIKINPAQ